MAQWELIQSLCKPLLELELKGILLRMIFSLVNHFVMDQRSCVIASFATRGRWKNVIKQLVI